MSKSKLLPIIGAFSAEERDAFLLFLQSPYFNTGNAAELIQLYQTLLQYSSGTSEIEVTIADLHVHFFPDKPFSAPRFERLYTRLGQLLNEFLVIQQYRHADNERQRSLDLTNVFVQKKQAVQYVKSLQNTKKHLQNRAIESTEDYLFGFQIGKTTHQWKSEFNTVMDDLEITETIQQLDLFYLSERTELLNRLLLQQKMITLKIADGLLTPIFNSRLTAFFESQSPLILVRRKIQELLLQEDPDTSEFQKLMELIVQYESRFSNETLKEIYTYLRNYCTLLINAGHSHFCTVLHQLQQNNLSRGFFYFNGQIPPNAFLNITSIALMDKKIDWARHFTEQHQHKIIQSPGAKDIYKLTVAMCDFAEKKYDVALQNIAQANVIPHFVPFLRRLELKIYYDTQSDLLMYKIDAFRKYITRTDPKFISAASRAINLKFLNILLQLAQSKPNDLKRAARITTRIKEKKAIAERSWLLEKAAELS